MNSRSHGSLPLPVMGLPLDGPLLTQLAELFDDRTKQRVLARRLAAV